MKLICAKNDLMTAINIALRAVPSKTTMKVLECILIKTCDDTIRLIANDLELGIETEVKGEIVEPGMIAINAKIFSDIVRKLPENDITIETDRSLNMKITCERSKFNISGTDGEEFPVLPAVERTNMVTMSQFTLREMIRQTVFSIAENENNKMLASEIIEIKGSSIRISALDGHRIAIRKTELAESYPNYCIAVPGKSLNEISKIFTGELKDKVNIYITDKHALFEIEGTIVLTRLVEGRFYNIDQMLSGDFETRIRINNRELLSSIDRATLLIKEAERKPVIIGITDDFMELKMMTQVGRLDEEIPIEKEGKDTLMGFNPRYLMEALRVIDDEEIEIFFINIKSPCFIKDKEGRYVYLILPVNIGGQE